MSQRIGHFYQDVTESKRRSIQWVSTDDQVFSSEWVVRPVGLLVEGTGITTESTTIQVSSGTAGVTYTVENQIIMLSTQKHKRNFAVTVEG